MDDIIVLLNPSQSSEIRTNAANVLLGFTTDIESLELILTNNELVCLLWNYSFDKDKEVSLAVTQILINMTSFTDKYIPSLDNISKMIKAFQDSGQVHLYNGIAKILSNASSIGDFANRVSGLLKVSDYHHFIQLLSQGKEQGYLAALMGNLAIIDECRKVFVEDSIISSLLSLLTMPNNVIVRRNIARLLQNLSLDVNCHSKLSESLPRIIYPLVDGGDDIDEDDMEKLPLDLQYLPEEKSRESDLQTRIFISDTLYLMSSSYAVRRLLREQNFYILLKKYDEWENDEKAKEKVQNVIYIIIQDDAGVDLRGAGECPAESEVQSAVLD